MSAMPTLAVGMLKDAAKTTDMPTASVGMAPDPQTAIIIVGCGTQQKPAGAA